MYATKEQKVKADTLRLKLQGYDEAEAAKLAREMHGLDLRETLLSKPMAKRNYRELFESEMRRANALLGRVIRLNRALQQLKAEKAALEKELLRARGDLTR